MDYDTLVAFLAAVFAVPGVTSIATALLRRLTDGVGVQPPVVVYVAAWILTGVLLTTGAVDLPAWAGDPTAYVGAWLLWAGGTAEIARRLYDLLYNRFYPTPPIPAGFPGGR